MELKSEKKSIIIDRIIKQLKGIYKNYILLALTNKVKVIIGIFILFIVSLYGFTKVAFVFFPDSDRNLITIDINLPEGNRIESTEKLVSDIETYISDSLYVNEKRKNGILDWSSYIGKGPESYDKATLKMKQILTMHTY